MKYVLMIMTLGLIGCASSSVKYKTGDCMKLYQTVKIMEVVAIVEGEELYRLEPVDQGQEKVRCPNSRVIDDRL